MLDLRGYHAAQLTDGVAQEGYSETPGAREVHAAGDVALVRQEFTMDRAGRDPVSALDVFSLVRSDGRWRVISVVSDTGARPAHPDAEADIQELMGRALAAHAYDPGGDHDWPTLDGCFVPGALMGLRFFPGDPDTWVLDTREFMDHPRRDNPLRDGFQETDRVQTLDVHGDVAVLRERFTMRFASRPPAQAVDVFTLARVDGAWRIVSFISDEDGEQQ